MSLRRLFPYTYLVFIVAVLVPTPSEQRLVLLGAMVILAFAIGPSVAWKLGRVATISAISLVPFVLAVQWAACSAQTAQQVSNCTLDQSVTVVARILLATSILLVAAANEWRGTLAATVNSLNLPRSLRITLAVAGAMIGEFRKAMIRVHHAFTSRGDALPSVSIGNLRALPRMLAIAWASVLVVASERLDNLWSSATFWERAMPLSSWRNTKSAAWRDTLVLTAAAATLLLVLMNRFSI